MCPRGGDTSSSSTDTNRAVIWKEFEVGKLFNIHPTKAYKLTNADLFDEEGKNPVVVNSSFNNGIGGYTKLKCTENAGIITFSDTTSADSIFYQDQDFVGYPHVQGMYPVGQDKDMWNSYSLRFFATVFRSKAISMGFDYSNKFTRETASKLKVKLPVTSDEKINHQFMEFYMKTLEANSKTQFNLLLRTLS